MKPEDVLCFTSSGFIPHGCGGPAPDGIASPSATVRAHDLVDGWGGREVVVDLASDSGAGFEVAR